MNKKMLILAVMLGCVAMIALFCGTAVAKVTGQCAGCHTMHNSQGGNVVASVGGPYGALLVADCVGCHTGSAAGNTGSNVTPFVHATAAPIYGADGTTGDTLAGGSFWWVAQAGNKTKGHNVEGIPGVFFDMLPPGYPGDGRGGRLPTWGATQQPTCAGTYGCHGDPAKLGNAAGIAGAHHGTVNFGYRWLKGIAGLEWNTPGITGGKWEYKPTATAHNQYKGVDRTSETFDDATTISSLCGQCHGNFHAHVDLSEGTWNTPWKRHPTDFDMGNVSTLEYGSYNTPGATTGREYSVSVPVASATVTSVLSEVFVGVDDAIVTCISCHRAHGTPNDDLLRWAYTMDAASSAPGTDNTGCFVCHTTKDDA